ncbi:MAG: phospholipase, partial [Gemmatimonadetes bacterium]|nr:phospholipase [Gemmatimonadota bacterium]
AESVVGASWMTREDRETEIVDYVAYLDRLGRVVLDQAAADTRVTVLGFSQGVATASRWVTRGEVRPHRLVLWGDFLPPDLDMERAADAWGPVDVFLVRGTEDGALQSDELAAAETGRIERAGLGVRRVEYEGGHDIDEATLVELARSD